MAAINVELNLDGGITGRVNVQVTDTPAAATSTATTATSAVNTMSSSLAALMEPLRQLLDRLQRPSGAIAPPGGPTPSPGAAVAMVAAAGQGARVQATASIGKPAEEKKEDSQFTNKLKELSNFKDAIDKLSAGWLDGLSNKMTEFITKGKVKWKDFFDSIVNGLIKTGVNSILGKAISWIGDVFKIAHTGGIIGADQLPSRGALFATAQRFHEGGFPGLQSDEVPAILRRGEGVFTPEQMKALGGVGSQQFNQTVNITVAGSAGTPEQNRDLADQIGRQLHDEMRGLVLQEMRREMRPGGMLRS
ncbi:phage tail tape measure protein [Azospirillum sp. RWY-5-1]|uniref:Phage tail tape measure protein n=1 Tax=Azospirillum oleiclasticum TaxID=2735135 RepID=A0ABX2TGA4_9PROT|nr:phage tail tape measure protein [Azospirillum oleiclasticum]NYZ17209.1 phage tail tape measure protein [Azospirillum oleiclasticum]NYZ23082.1 phage tail tape measure protein [Azospirillum oleiclasticum]